MKRLLALLVLGSALACGDIDAELEKRRDAGLDGGMGGGEGGGGGGAIGPMGGGFGGGEPMGGGASGGGGGATGGGGGSTGGGAGGGTPQGPTDGGLCLNGNCWENPLPQGNRLNAVWSNDGGEVWIVGEVGTVLRWTSRGFENFQESFPRNEDLKSVWGVGSHVWVVGARDPTLGGPTYMSPMHYDGSRWNEETWATGTQTDPELLTVRGRNENDVWAAGLSGVMARRNATGEWTGWVFPPAIGFASANLPALAFDADGGCRVALRNDLRGVARCEEDGGGTIELSLDASYEIAVNGLWSPYANVFRAAITREVTPGGATTGELWVNTDGGWRPDFTPPARGCMAGVPNFAYCGDNISGQGEPPVSLPAPLQGGDDIFGAWTSGTLSLGGGWLVGDNGAMHRHNGTQWQPMRRGSTESIFSLWVDSQRVLGSGTSGTVFTRGSDSTWSTTTLANGEGDTRDLWISPDGRYRVFVGINRNLLEGLNGAAPTQQVPLASGNVHQLNALWGPHIEDLWAVGTHSEIWHRTDAGWSAVWPTNDAGVQLWDIDGIDRDTAFIVGGGCQIFVRSPAADGGWGPAHPGACQDELFGVWAAPPNDAGLQAVAVGAGGHAHFRYNGLWSQSNAPTPGDLYDVWGTGPRDIWAVGEFGALVHYDGMQWSLIQTGARGTLESVRGRPLDGGALELFMGGNGGAILRRVVQLSP